jgi:predicted transcriptional regulator
MSACAPEQMGPEHFRRKLDASSVLSECLATMTRTLDSAALELLRAIFDLADADVRPSLDLLARLLDLDADRAKALLTALRRTGLVQHERLGLTMAGLAVATSISPTQLRPMQAPARALRVA